jgi:hypothetical protein
MISPRYFLFQCGFGIHPKCFVLWIQVNPRTNFSWEKTRIQTWDRVRRDAIHENFLKKKKKNEAKCRIKMRSRRVDTNNMTAPLGRTQNKVWCSKWKNPIFFQQAGPICGIHLCQPPTRLHRYNHKYYAITSKDLTKYRYIDQIE